MSRTYRCKKDPYLIRENRILMNYEWIGFRIYRSDIDPNSKEGKKALARFHSDAKHFLYEWKGPNWFHNMYAQRPYRRDCKKQIKKFMRNPDYEIQIRNKPYREYWD